MTDFGLAQIAGQRTLTLTGDLLGTLRYMSPEQAAGDAALVDHRTDVYSLGADALRAADARARLPGRRPPRCCSSRSSTRSRRRRGSTGVPAELETIVLKAMAKDPNQRYVSARRLAEDLKRFLDDRPILAKRPALITRVFKWCRRHKLVVGTAAAVLVALLSLGTLIHDRRVATGRQEASSYREMILGGITLLHVSSEPPRAQEKVESPVSGEVRPEAPAFICCSQTDQMRAWFAALKEDRVHSPDPFEAAVDQFEDAAQLLPSRPDAHYYLARALWTLGRKERALNEVSQVLRLDPGSLAAAALRSAIEGKDGEPYSHPENGAAGAGSEQDILPRAWLEFYVAATSKGWKNAAEAASTALERIHRGERCYDGLEAELLLGRGTARLEMGEFLRRHR